MTTRIHPGTLLRDDRGQVCILASDVHDETATHALLLLEGHAWHWPRASVLTLLRGLLRDGWRTASVLSPEHVEELVAEAQGRAKALGRMAGRRAA